jgi:hypothetical protein
MTEVSEVKFKKSWANISISGVALFTLTFLPGLLLFHDALVWGTDRQFAQYDSWETIIFAMASIWSCGIVLFWLFIRNLLVKFTNRGVWQRSVLRWKFIAWKDVTEIRQVGYGVHICDANQKIIIALVAYSNWSNVADFILNQVSAKTSQ